MDFFYQIYQFHFLKKFTISELNYAMYNCYITQWPILLIRCHLRHRAVIFQVMLSNYINHFGLFHHWQQYQYSIWWGCRRYTPFRYSWNGWNVYNFTPTKYKTTLIYSTTHSWYQGCLHGLVVGCWTTAHCSNLSVGISKGCFIFDFASSPLEVTRPI